MLIEPRQQRDGLTRIGDYTPTFVGLDAEIHPRLAQIFENQRIVGDASGTHRSLPLERDGHESADADLRWTCDSSSAAASGSMS